LQIFGGDAVEAAEPLLKPAAISIDVLDVQYFLVHMFTFAGDDEFIFDAFNLGEGDQRFSCASARAPSDVAVHAQQRIVLR
jgi:hypothetical protein